MKLTNLIPVTTPGIITPEMLAYMSIFLDKETVLETDQITVGPTTIECEYDEALAAADVIAHCIAAEKGGSQGIFINCFGDPGVRAARECVNIPVFGGFEPAIHLALGLADRIGIVTVMPNVVPMLEGNISKAGLRERVVSLRNINIPVEELQDHEKLCAALLKESLNAITEDGVQAIVLGCTAMVDVTETVKKGLLEQGYDIPMMEAAQSALTLLELSAKMGLKQSRITYMRPPEK